MKVKFRLGSTESYILFRRSLKAWNNLSELLRISTKKVFHGLFVILFFSYWKNNFTHNFLIITRIRDLIF